MDQPFPLSSLGMSPVFRIPNQPALRGASFFEQAFARDVTANPWGVVSTGVTRWTLGNGGGPGATVQTEVFALPVPAWGKYRNIVVTMRLN